MASLFQSPIGKLRVIGMLEGASFLLLLGVGMPLKYIMDEPLPVKVLGPVHGILFLWLLTAISAAVFSEEFCKKRAAAVFIACLLPFGPFLLDKKLKLWQEEFEA